MLWQVQMLVIVIAASGEFINLPLLTNLREMILMVGFDSGRMQMNKEYTYQTSRYVVSVHNLFLALFPGSSH